MKEYLSQIHTKPQAHKKRFALLVSAGVTLIIFSIWSAVTFGGNKEVAKETTGPVNLAAVSRGSKITPFGNIIGGIKDTWASLGELIGNGR